MYEWAIIIIASCAPLQKHFNGGKKMAKKTKTVTANLEDAVTIFINRVGLDVVCYIDRNTGTMTTYDYDEIDIAENDPDLICLPYAEVLLKSYGNTYRMYLDKYNLIPNDHERQTEFLRRTGRSDDYQDFENCILTNAIQDWLESEGFKVV